MKGVLLANQIVVGTNKVEAALLEYLSSSFPIMILNTSSNTIRIPIKGKDIHRFNNTIPKKANKNMTSQIDSLELLSTVFTTVIILLFIKYK